MTDAFRPLPLSKVDRNYYARQLCTPEEIIRKCDHYGVPLEEIPKLNAFFRTIILFEKVKLDQKLYFQKRELWRSSIGPHLDRYEMPKNIENNSKIWNAVKYRRWKRRRNKLDPIEGEKEFLDKLIEHMIQ